jgi:4,5-dihydroxyphthalate decarboxylase
MRTLKTLTRAQGANAALLDGTVTPAGCRLELADEPVLVRGFRKMVRDLEYDVAELSITTYLTAKEHGAAISALPVFIVREFHHGATQVLRDGPIKAPADLAGGRVGVNRGYTVTTGVWGRAALAAAGLDLDSVTWVRSGDEHVATFQPPANVVAAPEGRTLEQGLLAGDLDAVVGASIDHPDVVPLLPEPRAAGLAALAETGVFPINHLVVVRDSLLAEDPALGPAVFTAFAEAKRRYVAELRAGRSETAQDRLLAEVMAVSEDPLPYGIAPNLATLEALLTAATAQHILTRPVDLERVFVPSTLGLVG